MNAMTGHLAHLARPARGSSPATPVGILDLLHWAFQVERVDLEFDPAGQSGGVGLPGFGMEHVLIEQARLGCRVDGGGRSECHPDADSVAAALVALPEACGGRSMAIRIAELARAGRVPDAMVGAEPRLHPAETHTNRYGCHAKVRDARELGVPGTRRRNRKGVIVEDPVPYCPVVIRPTVGEIGNARRQWLRWWGALLELRGTFQSYGGLTAFELTDAMPPRTPWDM